jgi:hypothetical protein
MTFMLADEPRLVFPASHRATVPFRRGVNHVIVDTIDESGTGYVFVIDTGASFSVVTPGFLARVRTEVASDRSFDSGGPEGRTPAPYRSGRKPSITQCW